MGNPDPLVTGFWFFPPQLPSHPGVLGSLGWHVVSGSTIRQELGTDTRQGCEALEGERSVSPDSFEPASPLDIFKRTLIPAGLPVWVWCHCLLVL